MVSKRLCATACYVEWKLVWYTGTCTEMGVAITRANGRLTRFYFRKRCARKCGHNLYSICIFHIISYMSNNTILIRSLFILQIYTLIWLKLSAK